MLFKEFEVDFNKEPGIFRLVYKRENSTEAIRFLFKNGLSIANVDREGMRCIDYVLKDYLRNRGRDEVLDILLEEGLNLSEITDPLSSLLCCMPSRRN